jgi:hypothetical protein
MAGFPENQEDREKQGREREPADPARGTRRFGTRPGLRAIGGILA